MKCSRRCISESVFQAAPWRLEQYGTSQCKWQSNGMQLQTFMLAVFSEESQNIQDETGPIDDGFIANAVGSLPSDPFCCAGPEPLDDGKLDNGCHKPTTLM